MADLLGFTSISILSLITLLIALRWPDISKILFTALIVRVVFMLIGHYITPLPDSGGDAENFEVSAWLMGQNGFFNLFNYYIGPDPKFISWIIAIPYSLFGRSILMAQSICVFFGIINVFLGWKIASILWDSSTAKKVGWTIALFPSLVLYSVLVLREVYVCFFLLVALYGVVSWSRTNNFKSIILAMIGFVGAIFFHGATAIGAMTFMVIVGIISLNQLYKSLRKNRINLKVLLILLLFIIALGLYLSNNIKLPYLNNYEFASNISILLEKTKLANMGEASYPDWLVATSPIELLYKSPLRSIYFIFSPFPWDVRETRHLIGMFDSFLYMYLFFLISCNLKVILRDRALRIILIILLSYIFVFGVGVGNFGTGLRHRSKFVVMFILLAAPLIKRLVFFKKNS